MQREAVTPELGAESPPPAVTAFIDQEFEIARPVFEGRDVIVSEKAKHEAEWVFRETIYRCARDID